MFDLSIEKLAVIGLIALFLVGPERLPAYAAKLGAFVRTAKVMIDGAKVRVREEMGPEFDDVDWQRLDPRQYDPRRIIRDALTEPPAAVTAEPVLVARAASRPAVPGRAVAYDPEST